MTNLYSRLFKRYASFGYEANLLRKLLTLWTERMVLTRWTLNRWIEW